MKTNKSIVHNYRTTPTSRAWSTTCGSCTRTPRTPSAATSARPSSPPRSHWGSTCSRTTKSSTSEGRRQMPGLGQGPGLGPGNWNLGPWNWPDANARPISIDTTLSNSDCQYVYSQFAKIYPFCDLEPGSDKTHRQDLPDLIRTLFIHFLLYLTQEVQLYHEFL